MPRLGAPQAAYPACATGSRREAGRSSVASGNLVPREEQACWRPWQLARGRSGQRDVNLLGGGEVAAGGAQVSAGGRGYVGVVTPGGDGQVIRAGAAAVA